MTAPVEPSRSLVYAPSRFERAFGMSLGLIVMSVGAFLLWRTSATWSTMYLNGRSITLILGLALPSLGLWYFNFFRRTTLILSSDGIQFNGAFRTLRIPRTAIVGHTEPVRHPGVNTTFAVRVKGQAGLVKLSSRAIIDDAFEDWFAGIPLIA